MPPAFGVGITSIPREMDLCDNLHACRRFHQQSKCTKPSQKPKVTRVRDAFWKNEKKPELFFDSRRYLKEAVQHTDRAHDDINQKPLSVTAQACSGGSTYVELLMKQMGY